MSKKLRFCLCLSILFISLQSIAKTTEQGVDSLIEAVKELNRDLNIPKTLREAGVDEQEFLAKVDKLSEMAFEDQCTTANPRVPLVHEIKELMLQAYYGERE